LKNLIHGLVLQPSPLVEFLLVRHPDETTLQPLIKDDIRISGEAPVSVLQSFLGSKLSHTPTSDIEILAQMADGCFVLLNTLLQLGHVRREFSSFDETLVLYYRLKV